VPENKSNPKVLALFPAYNEEGKIGKAVSSIPKDVVSEVLVIDDGSTDKTLWQAQEAGAKVIRNLKRQGVGSVIRQGIEYAQGNNFSIIVILAGNNKDDGRQIPRLIEPIIKGDYDFVQGSRFIKEGSYGRMPFYRLIATRYIHPTIFSFFALKRITDSTNGFRAIRVDIFKDKRIDLNQDWLNNYELEPYLFFKVIELGYRFKEVPVSKIYPPGNLGYTKMRPVIDWWSILKPILLLGLKIKR